MSMLLRRQMMQKTSGELYPIGTDVVDVYIRNGSEPFEANTIISSTTGEITSTTGNDQTSAAYIPVDPAYTLRKNYGPRLTAAAWYDSGKNFISWFNVFDVGATDFPTAPSNAKYLRVTAYNGTMANSLTITRTA